MGRYKGGLMCKGRVNCVTVRGCEKHKETRNTRSLINKISGDTKTTLYINHSGQRMRENTWYKYKVE